MDYERQKSDKRLANILSIIWPGMGLIYQSKWRAGFIFIIIHVLSVLWVFRNVFFYYVGNIYVEEIVLMLSIGIVVVNWLVSLAVTNSDQ